MSQLPTEFIERIKSTFGKAGANWLDILPTLINDYTQQWSLQLQPHFEPLSYNFVAPVIRDDGSQAVLKLGVPNHEMRSEIAALRVYAGHGAVHLLKADPDAGAFLIERLIPGIPLVELEDDEKATEIAAQVMQQLWRSTQDLPGLQDLEGLLTLEKWAKGFQRLRARFNGDSGPYPESILAQAEAYYNDLNSSAETQVVLHGDLHHWNILSAEREPWLALDPKGVIGDPAFEVAAWMLNPVPDLIHWPDFKQVTARRLDQFSEILEFGRERLRCWSLAQAVLSSWWSMEDNTSDFEYALTIANLLSEL